MGTDNIMNRVKKLKRRLSLAFNKFPLTNGANGDQQQPHRTHNGKSSRGGIPYSASTSEGLNHICNGGEGDVGIEFSASSFTLNDADSVGAIQQLSDSISPVSHSDSYRSGHTNGSVGVNGHSETHAFGQSLYRLRSGGSSGAIGGDSKYLAREIQKSRRVHSVIALQESISELAERLEESSVGTHEEMSYEPKIIMRNKQKKAAEKVMRQSDSGYASQNGHAVSGNAEYSHARTYVRHSESSKSHLVSAYDRRHSLHGSKGAVVQEHPAIGSDGESIDGSYTSDEVTSPGRISSSSGIQVRMRPKPVRRFSEQDIQKRLSLPADLRLPLSVVEKLNRTPTLEQPLTRKNRRVSLHEIGFGKLESYQKLEKLGEGTYATVYRGRSRLTNNLVALKEIRLEHEEGAPCTAIREVSLLRDLRHANVVTLHDIIHTDQCLTLVFEYLERDLKQYMDECGNILSMNNVRLFLFQLLRGLAYCHARRVLHRDLKPQNLLINQKGELKLADFGLARAKSVPTKTYSNEVVTLWYRPPDVLLGSIDYSTHIDMWGVGCILYEMAAGRPFFPGSSADEQVHLIFRALGTPNPDLHPLICQSAEFKAYHFPQYRAEPLVNHAPRLDLDGLDLLAQLLQYEGRKRISARDALHHHFFAVFGLAVHKLPDTASIFTIPGIQLTRDPGYRPPRGFGDQIFSQNKNRRQSMLL